MTAIRHTPKPQICTGVVVVVEKGETKIRKVPYLRVVVKVSSGPDEGCRVSAIFYNESDVRWLGFPRELEQWPGIKVEIEIVDKEINWHWYTSANVLKILREE